MCPGGLIAISALGEIGDCLPLCDRLLILSLSLKCQGLRHGDIDKAGSRDFGRRSGLSLNLLIVRSCLSCEPESFPHVASLPAHGS